MSRSSTGELIHHSDRGGQYLSIHYTERLAEVGIESSVGSVGDSCDNALPEAINSRYKTEIIRYRGPWKDIDEVEYSPLEQVGWFNHRQSLGKVKATKRRKIFPTDDSAKKVIYLAIQEASKKWAMPIKNWKAALNRFMIEFEDQLADYV